jgi:hypothetical protein
MENPLSLSMEISRQTGVVWLGTEKNNHQYPIPSQYSLREKSMTLHNYIPLRLSRCEITRLRVKI